MKLLPLLACYGRLACLGLVADLGLPGSSPLFDNPALQHRGSNGPLMLNDCAELAHQVWRDSPCYPTCNYSHRSRRPRSCGYPSRP